MAHSRREAPPFDQGIFLLHLNKGREALRSGNVSTARAELRTALSIRPGDEDVSNLLSVVYFRAGEFDEAEKITRVLVAENPDSAVLHSNLGIIHVKTGALDEAEAELRRAIELKPDHAKSHLYLGFVYRQKRKLGLALEHFGYAGADRLVAELQEELRRSSRESAEGRAAVRVDGAPAESTTAKLVIPAEFRSSSAAAPKPAATARTGPIPVARPAPVPAAPPAPTLPSGPPARLFRIRDNGTVEITFEGEVLVRRGTVASYGGRIAFAADPRLAGTRAEALLRATGKGSIFLADRGRKPILVELDDEFFSAEGSRILAIGPTLSFRYEPIHDFPRRRRVDVLKIFGKGGLVLSPARASFSIPVSADFPLNVSSRDLVGWSGNLVPSVLPDRFLDEVMLPDSEDPPKIRFEGEGTVFTESPA
ncbi:MAG TPA: tetratricopeptide repeat protein [Thermoanaerobaculia bacterium]|nr:tetratricopeptide repeat protein [Thermoanaerobaculia bacterium]